MSIDLTEAIEQYHQSVTAFIAGDPDLQKRMWSRRDDVTLANPLGPTSRGWDEVEATLDRTTEQLGSPSNETIVFDRISIFATNDLAYIVEIERDWIKLEGRHVLVSLRVTTIFRCEHGEWRIVHRHADTVTTPRAIETLAE